MGKIRVIISGGGTGGHIFPAISIADAIMKRFPDNAEILFVGAEHKMEMRRVPDAGYDIIGLPIEGFNRKKLHKNLKVFWMLQKSIRRAKKIVRNFNPHIAVGVGGYASGPLMKAASSSRIPILLQEQNSYPGITNRYLAKSASTICVAYEGMEKYFPKEKIVITGNPCRENLLNQNFSKDEAYAFFDLNPSKRTILVIGGSLGARQINRSIQENLELIGESDVQIIWQAGELYFHELFLELPNRRGSANIRLYPFIDRMNYAYKVADLVISRAGAGSISELALLKKPAILVPSPNVAEDHQTKNAKALVDKKAALLIPDASAQELLIPTALEMVKDQGLLDVLSENISKFAQPDSANRIVDEILKLVKDKLEKEYGH